MGTINEFTASVKEEGLMRSSRFDIEFALPKLFDGNESFSPDMKKVHLYCDAVTLPGLSLLTSESVTYGEQRELPYGKQFENINMSFYADNDMSVKMLFDIWINNIQGSRSRNMAYYNDYITDMKIIVNDTQENTRYTVELFECYPKAVSAINLDMSSREVMKIQVSMNYKYWRSEQGQAVTSGGEEFADTLQKETQPVPEKYYSTNAGQQIPGYKSFENTRNSLFNNGKLF